jgi:hypothetical protein
MSTTSRLDVSPIIVEQAPCRAHTDARIVSDSVEAYSIATDNADVMRHVKIIRMHSACACQTPPTTGRAARSNLPSSG